MLYTLEFSRKHITAYRMLNYCILDVEFLLNAKLLHFWWNNINNLFLFLTNFRKCLDKIENFTNKSFVKHRIKMPCTYNYIYQRTTNSYTEVVILYFEAISWIELLFILSRLSVKNVLCHFSSFKLISVFLQKVLII